MPAQDSHGSPESAAIDPVADARSLDQEASVDQPAVVEPHAMEQGAPMSHAPASDEALMLKFRDGDYAAFEALYTKHRKPLFGYIVRQCGNEAIAEELFQDSWMNLIRARERYTPSAKFTSLLYRIAHNRIIDYVRVSANDMRVHAEFSDDIHSPDRETATSLPTEVELLRQRTIVRNAIAALPQDQRDVLLLHEEAGLTLETIAQVVGVGRETAKSRLRYALTKLRDALEVYR